MQSFLTIFIAGISAFMAIMMMNPETMTVPDAFAEVEPGPVLVSEPADPLILVRSQLPLVLAQDFYASLEARFDMWAIDPSVFLLD